MNSLWGASSFDPNRPEATNNLNNWVSVRTIKNIFLQYKPVFSPPPNIQPTSWSLASGFLWLLYLWEIFSLSGAQWKLWSKELFSTWFTICKFTIKELFLESAESKDECFHRLSSHLLLLIQASVKCLKFWQRVSKPDQPGWDTDESTGLVWSFRAENGHDLNNCGYLKNNVKLI